MLLICTQTYVEGSWKILNQITARLSSFHWQVTRSISNKIELLSRPWNCYFQYFLSTKYTSIAQICSSYVTFYLFQQKKNKWKALTLEFESSDLKKSEFRIRLSERVQIHRWRYSRHPDRHKSLRNHMFNVWVKVWDHYSCRFNRLTYILCDTQTLSYQ